MENVENLKDTFTIKEYKEAYTMMDLHIKNMTREKKETCGFVPLLHYFNFADDT